MSNRGRWYQTETEEQKQAFELYYGLGLKRSYSTIASQTGVSLSTMKNWGKAFDWQQRVEQRDALKRQELAESISADNADTVRRLLQIARATRALTMKNATEKPSLLTTTIE